MSTPWLCTALLFCQTELGEQTWRVPTTDVFSAVHVEPTSNSPLESADFIGEEELEGIGDISLVIPPNHFAASWLASGGAYGFGTFDLDYNRTWYLPIGVERPPVAITPGLGMHFWSGPRDLDLPARVYDLYLDVSWRPIDHENGGFAFGVTPGIYGDFDNLDGNSFQVTGWGLANRRFGPHWNLVGGVAVVRQLKSSVLPIGGVIWTPNEETRLELMIPRPRIARRVWQQESAEMWCYLAGQFGGGAWSVADTPTENVLVSYSDLRLLLGVETFNTAGYELTLELGYAFARDISVNQATVFTPDSTFLLQATFAL